MKKKRWLKSIVASLLTTLAIVLPMTALSPEVQPTLSFEGVELVPLADGSVQLLMKIYVNYTDRSNGAFFNLQYHSEYLSPSDMATNKIIAGNGVDAAFFAPDKLLYAHPESEYGGADTDRLLPAFTTNFADTNKKYSTVTPPNADGIGGIEMNLFLDQKMFAPSQEANPGTSLKRVEIGEGGEPYLVFQSRSSASDDESKNKVALGTLSFAVNKAKLPELVENFNGIEGKTPLGKNGKTMVGINVTAAATDQWTIGACTAEGPGGQHKYYGPGERAPYNKAGLWYRFNFPKTMVDARAADETVTVNAYQNYTTGRATDMPITLGKYSPMVTATYADGSKENFTMPWGKAGSGYEFINLPAAEPVTRDYAATGGQYEIRQKFSWVGADGKAQFFPVPVTVDFTVTPIKLQSVTAENLTKAYWLNKVQGQVKTGAALKLPEQARLVTDVAPGTVTLAMPIPGWSPTEPLSQWPVSTGDNASTLMNSLKADGAVAGTPPAVTAPYWPADGDGTAEVVSKTPEKFVGKYTFTMAESYGGAAATFTKAQITALYPWMTVEKETYALPNALRRIVAETEPGGGTSPPVFTDAAAYTASWVSTMEDTGENPTMTLKVMREGESMDANSVFRVRLPSGLELGTGLTSEDDGTKFVIENWFVDDGSYAAATATDATGTVYFNLITNPGDTASGGFHVERETLRRFINLGGWFTVSVCEDTTARLWSDEIPVYVPPRDNRYREDKTYHFLGENAALYGWPGGVGTAFALPRGMYPVVNATGDALYVDNGSGADTTDPATGGTANLRKTESYGYTTTYDGDTGAQPGALYSVKVTGGAAWTPRGDGNTTGGNGITRYGPDQFLDLARFVAYGTVKQPVQKKNVTLSTERTAPIAQTEKITLTCDSPTGIERYPNTGDLTNNVSLVTYDTRGEGYTYYQTYTLKITNVGTTDIYGLDIDGLTDGYDSDGGHFKMLQPPAAFLAAGTFTTFTMTYVPNLKANAGNSLNYRDRLYITSSSHPKADPTQPKPTDYLLDFDAQFQVVSGDVYKVRVLTRPGDGTLGTAGLVIGETTQAGKKEMDYTPTTTSFVKDDMVYVVVEPKDEYTVKSYSAVGDTTGTVTIAPYNPKGTESDKAKLEPGKQIYSFKLPADDVTVTITFTEDIFSKLRLSDLIDFSAGAVLDGDGAVAATADSFLKRAVETVDSANTYRVWQKTYTKAESDAANSWGTISGAVDSDRRDLHLMTTGAAKRAGNAFDSKQNQYLVVIPFAASRSQVEATLRKVVYHDLVPNDGNLNDNPDIKPNISMNYYTKNPVVSADAPAPLPIYTGSHPDTGTNTIVPGDTAAPTVHTTAPFDSPAPGASTFVRIAVSLTETVTTTRYYYLEIHRAPETVAATLNYGNAPYGMIMNEPNLISGDAAQTEASRNAAKADFVAHNYNFSGMKAAYIPNAVKNAGIAGATYWREAWVPGGKYYEPESGLGVGDAAVYSDGANLDLNDYAFFAILGESMKDPGIRAALDSSGRPVKLEDIAATATVKLMDLSAAATAQRWRFTGYDPDSTDPNAAAATKELVFSRTTSGTLKQVTGQAGDTYTWAQWANRYAPIYQSDGVTQAVDAEGNLLFGPQPVAGIRPGKYTLVYTFRDYDGLSDLTVTRPFNILAPVGDINADCAVSNGAQATDEYLLKGRVGDPLGYDAVGYPEGNLFRLRTCDVNNDRNINNIDANVLNAGTTGLLRFYLPTDYK